MQTTCLAIGDPHFKRNNVRETRQMVARILQTVDTLQPDFIVVLGDTLHDFECYYATPFKAAMRFVRALAQRRPTYVLIGNHDIPTTAEFMPQEHPFVAFTPQEEEFHTYPNLTIIDQTTRFAVADRWFVGVPYVPPGRFAEAIALVDNSQVTAYFCHQEFQGAIRPEEGDVWPLSAPLVIAGHIHKYMELQPNIIYVGTPMQHEHGESPDNTISLFTFTVQGWSQQRIDLQLCKRETIYLPIAELTEAWQPPADRIVRLVLQGDAGARKTLASHPVVQRLEVLGVKVVFQTLVPKAEAKQLGGSFLEELYGRIANDKVREMFWNCFRSRLTRIENQSTACHYATP